jgi:hypothetical protein
MIINGVLSLLKNFPRIAFILRVILYMFLIYHLVNCFLRGKQCLISSRGQAVDARCKYTKQSATNKVQQNKMQQNKAAEDVRHCVPVNIP